MKWKDLIHRFDAIAIAVITLVYSAFALFQLGDFSAPQSFETLASPVVVRLEKEARVSSALVYLGIGSGKYALELSRDGRSWEPFASADHSGVFVWKRLSGQGQGSFVRISQTEGSGRYGEIAFFDGEGNRIPAVPDGSALTDEQAVAPQRPTYLNGTYFDEIYHPRTAYEILHRMPPYEVTHPPLGKLIISVGVALFGMTPFGWRIMGTLAGILMVPLFYLLCRRLGVRRELCAVATVLFAFDFMHFSQTRLATIDSFSVLFVMISYYFMLCYLQVDFHTDRFKKALAPLALSGLFFGIGAATKWSCLYGAPGLGVLLLYHWVRAYPKKWKRRAAYRGRLFKTIGWCALFFIAVPAVIYGLSYLPQLRYDLRGRGPLQYIIENQGYMFNYHKGITQKHPYASPWYSWLVVWKPLWAYFDGELRGSGVISTISSFGNPLVWWGGLLAIAAAMGRALIRKGDTGAVFVCAGYLSMILPWVLVPRIVFIYHYFACVPFLVLAIGLLMEDITAEKGVSVKWYYGYAAAAFVLFVLFFPVISGLPVSQKYVGDYLVWFSSWTFMN